MDVLAEHRGSTADVLTFAWDAGVFRADHVMAALGLTRTTALRALDSLIELGLIRELSTSESEQGGRLGRPARRFALRGEAGVVIGIDAGYRHLTTVVADLAGRVLAREQVEVDDSFPVPGGDLGDRAVEARRAAVTDALAAGLAAAGSAAREVVAVAVGVPAPVDGHGGSPPHSDHFWQLMNADLRTALGERFPVARVENDAALAALAEGSLGAARGCDHFVAMLSGRRLGAGVVLEGRLMRGAHGGVGELGGMAFVPGVGGAWGLGDRAEAWVREALEADRIPSDHPWASLRDGELSAEAVLASATLADPVARPLIEDLGDRLGRVCTLIAHFYDPEVIVVCGAVAGSLGEVLEIASDFVARELELPPPAIVASELAGDAVSLGAVSAAREAAQRIALPLLSSRRREAEG